MSGRRSVGRRGVLAVVGAVTANLLVSGDGPLLPGSGASTRSASAPLRSRPVGTLGATAAPAVPVRLRSRVRRFLAPAFSARGTDGGATYKQSSDGRDLHPLQPALAGRVTDDVRSILGRLPTDFLPFGRDTRGS
ncbi:hypothetical protein [Natrinema gelatinilyticum]|uniref:hypothetical protein n=1 Tax=Natrinema gelatinilyticum TaxID=2961571 RepID=UPI0020C47AB0|nr:hypothetical protein [Natrinema gelatinilyticum]